MPSVVPSTELKGAEKWKAEKPSLRTKQSGVWQSGLTYRPYRKAETDRHASNEARDDEERNKKSGPKAAFLFGLWKGD